MAIKWSSWETSGPTGMRVGIDVDWESITHGETVATATIKIYTENEAAYDDDQELNYGGSISGSTSFHNDDGSSPVLRATKTYGYSYSGSSYGSSPGTKTFTASISGAYNGVTPSVSVTSSIPARPIAAPDEPSSPTISRVSDTTTKVSWGNRSTSGEPWTSVTVQQEINASDNWVSAASLSGSATSFSDGTSADNKYRYRIRSNNGAGSSSWVYTDYLLTTPSTPTSLVRTNSSTIPRQDLDWNNNSPGYTNYQTEIFRGVTPAGGSTAWTFITAVGAGTTSYTDTAALANQATKYRIRHKTTYGSALYSGYSNETSATPGVTVPPLAPTRLNPSGISVDPTLQQRLTWQFNAGMSGDTQKKYEVQHRKAGETSWKTILATSGSQFYDLPANTYAVDQTVQWQVRTYGQNDALAPSPWSVPVTFKTAIAPIPPDPVKIPVQLDLFTGRLEANPDANELREYAARAQAVLTGGGVKAVNASYGVTWSQRFITIGLGRTSAGFKDGYHDIVNPFGWTITAKQIVVTGGISTATLTVSASTMRVKPGERITVSGVGSPYDGIWVCRSISSNQISYELAPGTAAQANTVSGGAMAANITGHAGQADIVPSGGVIPLPTWGSLYYELPFGWGTGNVPKKNGVVNVTSKQVTSNVATLGINGGHWFGVGNSITVEIGDPVFDGGRVITAVTPSSIQFALTTANQGPTAISAATALARPGSRDTFFGNFHVVGYTSGTFAVPSNWVMIALRNSDAAVVEWGSGEFIDPGYDSDSPVYRQVILSSTSDVTSSAGNKPALRIGDIAGSHMRIDGNEIQAMADDNSVGSLIFNANGGNSAIGLDGYTVSLKGTVYSPDAPTTSTSANAVLGSTGILYKSTSSRRAKDNIRDLGEGLDPEHLLELRPRLYNSVLPLDPPDFVYAGFIAEEAEELGLEHWVERGEDGRVEGFRYGQWTAALQAIARSQQARILELEARLSAVEKRQAKPGRSWLRWRRRA